MGAKNLRRLIGSSFGLEVLRNELIAVRADVWVLTFTSDLDVNVTLNGNWVFPNRKLPRSVMETLQKLFFKNRSSLWLYANRIRDIVTTPLLVNVLPIWKFISKVRQTSPRRSGNLRRKAPGKPKA